MRNLIYLVLFFFTGIIVLRLYWEHKEAADNNKEKDHDDQEKTD